MKRDNRVYLQHMLDAMNKVDEYVQGIDEQIFLNRTMVQDAVIRQIEIPGEAVRHLPGDLHDHYPHIPWRISAGMRDKLIHNYFGVDLLNCMANSNS